MNKGTEVIGGPALADTHPRYTMQDVHAGAHEATFTVLSTFTGGDGLGIGLSLAGGQVRVASEFVAEAARSHRENRPGVPVDERDIRELDSPEKVQEFMALGDLKPGEPDMGVGAPPCCENSTAGRGLREPGVVRAYSDTKQRAIGTLIFDLVKVMLVARPKVVIFENVPGIAHANNGSIFRRARRALCFAGDQRNYFAAERVLCAADYGVPQARKRLIMIAVRTDVSEVAGISSDEDVMRVFPAPTHRPVSVRAALAGLQQSDADLQPWRRAIMSSTLYQYARLIPHDPDWPMRLKDVGLPPQVRFTLVRSSWDHPCPTLTVAGQRLGAYTGVLHPDEDRLFTLPELRRLMGVPDDYIPTGTLNQASERLCRMVPPPMAKAIADSVYRRVLVPHREAVK